MASLSVRGTAGARYSFPLMGRSSLLLFAFLLAACADGSQADLQYIKQARSIAAEWALVNEKSAAGKLTPAYVASMHEWLQDGLQTATSSVTQPNSSYGIEMRALFAEPADAAPARLRARAQRLKRIEDDLESD